MAAARTVPMMATRRFVLVRGAERWDASDADGVPVRSPRRVRGGADRLDVHGDRRLQDRRPAQARRSRRKKQGFLVSCDPLDARSLPGWIAERFASKGPRHRSRRRRAARGPRGAEALVGRRRRSSGCRSTWARGPPIDEDAVGACVARVRTADTWALVDAVGARDLGRALRTLADAYDPRERGLPLLGALAWSVRQLARYQAAVESGAPADEAARRAGVFQPVPRARAGQQGPRRPAERGRTLDPRARRDRPGAEELAPDADAILEEMLTRLCRAETREAARASDRKPA